jgi:hypothetical protein
VLVNYGEISTEELLGSSGVDALVMAFWPVNAQNKIYPPQCIPASIFVRI